MDTIDIEATPEGIDTYYAMYLNKLLTSLVSDTELLESIDYGCAMTCKGEKMYERQGNVIYVQFD